MEDLVGIRVDSKEPARNIPLVGRHDGVLGNVFDLVGLGVWVWYGGVLSIFAEPLLTRRQPRVFVGSGIERVCCFMDVDVEVPHAATIEEDVTAEVVSSCTIGNADRMSHELSGADGYSAKDSDELVE